MAGPYYADEIQGSTDTTDASLITVASDRREGATESGALKHMRRSYSFDDDEAATEIIHIARFPAGVTIIPSLCTVTLEDPGALVVNIGNYTQADTPVVIDVDKYSEDLNLGAGTLGMFRFTELLANIAAGDGTNGGTLQEETVPVWLSMTIVSETLANTVTAYFDIFYKHNG